MDCVKQNTVEMETKLKRIEALSNKNPQMKFECLISHFTKGNLICCFHELDGKKAKGVDGKSKEEYGFNLEENIESLIDRMKRLKYYPAPVKEVKIPKGNGKYRPLGISTIEDKIVQSMYAKILGAIYEPHFTKDSYGFRPGLSCHDAIKSVHGHLNREWDGVVIDVDLSNFFGTINHRKLIQILELRIKDKTFLRYIVRMLRSGILADGELSKSDIGTPQGSVVSPVLSNIFAHYAIDLWMREVVPQYISGKIHFVRYADDFVICTNTEDAPRILEALEGRLTRFSLELNREKTKVLNFSRSRYGAGVKQGVFTFLGFMFYIGRTRRGQPIVKLQTASKTFAKKLKDLTAWCKRSRNVDRLAMLWDTMIRKIRGHVQYYGISHNIKRVESYIHKAVKIFFKWINRRSQRKSFTWGKFSLYMKLRPLPQARVVHRLF